MIDPEYLAYTSLKNHVLASFPALECSSIEQDVPPKFPFLAFEQIDCPVAMEHYYGSERYVAPKFRIYVYTENNDKALAKEILACADEYMASVGFIRTFGPQKVKNDLPGICQMMTLYDGNLVDENGVVYQR